MNRQSTNKGALVAALVAAAAPTFSPGSSGLDGARRRIGPARLGLPRLLTPRLAELAATPPLERSPLTCLQVRLAAGAAAPDVRWRRVELPVRLGLSKVTIRHMAARYTV